MRYNVIAIEREFASGGLEIGEKLAEKLGIPCYGQEIFEKAVAKIGLPSHELNDLEESVTGSLLYSLNVLADVASGRNMDLTRAQKLALVESDIIRELSLNPCVIIGRSSAGLLKDKDTTLKVFIHADSDVRIKRAVEIYGIDPKQAESILRRYDKRRTNYFKATTNVEWKDAGTYHMFLNSGKLGIDSVVDILCTAVKYSNMI